jgi:hypothetical protein
MKRYAIAGTAVTLAATAAGAVIAASPATAAGIPAAARVPAAVRVPAAAGLWCHASMSNSHPADYTSIYVNVDTVRHASVTTVAHYRTVNRKHTGRANNRGNAKIDYYISGATPGYRVKVSVTVTSGRDHGSCSTSFTPHR